MVGNTALLLINGCSNSTRCATLFDVFMLPLRMNKQHAFFSFHNAHGFIGKQMENAEILAANRGSLLSKVNHAFEGLWRSCVLAVLSSTSHVVRTQILLNCLPSPCAGREAERSDELTVEAGEVVQVLERVVEGDPEWARVRRRPTCLPASPTAPTSMLENCVPAFDKSAPQGLVPRAFLGYVRYVLAKVHANRREVCERTLPNSLRCGPL